MKHLLTGEELPDEDSEAGVSSGNNFKKDIPVNDNDAAEVSEALTQIEQKTREAVDVLLKVSEKGDKKVLFPEVDQLLHIQCVYKKPGTTGTGHRAKRIVLPHPLHEKGNTTVCLIMRDLDHSEKARHDPDVDKQAREWAERLERQFGVTKEHVQKILTKRQLEREYHSYYERRQLASAYDIFLVDFVVEKSVTHFCGKEFHKAKKMPLRLLMHPHRSLIREIERAYYTITLPFSPFRTRTSLRVGNLSNPVDHIVENVRAAVENVFRYCPGGLNNIQSLNLQLVTGGPSLPLYISAGPRNAVKTVKPMKKKDLQAKRNKNAIVDELSTLPEGMEVSVHKDGEVEVLESETKKSVLYPTVDDEWEKGDDLKPRINPAKREKMLEKRRKLNAKRKKAREAKKKLLPPLNDGVPSIKGLLKKKAKENKFDEVGARKRKLMGKTKMTINKKSKSQRNVKLEKKKNMKATEASNEA